MLRVIAFCHNPQHIIKFGDKYDKKLMGRAANTGIDAAKTTCKRVVKKTAKTSVDLIGKK